MINISQQDGVLYLGITGTNKFRYWYVFISRAISFGPATRNFGISTHAISSHIKATCILRVRHVICFSTGDADIASNIADTSGRGKRCQAHCFFYPWCTYRGGSKNGEQSWLARSDQERVFYSSLHQRLLGNSVLLFVARLKCCALTG